MNGAIAKGEIGGTGGQTRAFLLNLVLFGLWSVIIMIDESYFSGVLYRAV